MQFFVPVHSTVEEFTATVQKKCVDPIKFELDNIYKGTESVHHF